jgi:hypothetical protein
MFEKMLLTIERMSMINRRQFLQIAGAGAAGFLTGGMSSLIDKEMAYAALQGDCVFTPDL